MRSLSSTNFFLPVGEYGMRRSMIYFLKPSYWSRRRKRYVEVSSVYEAEVNGTPTADESVEPVSPEFRGKEAIRYQFSLFQLVNSSEHYLMGTRKEAKEMMQQVCMQCCSM